MLALLMVIAAAICGRCIMKMVIDLGILRSDISKLRKEKESLFEEIRAAADMLESVNTNKPKDYGRN